MPDNNIKAHRAWRLFFLLWFVWLALARFEILNEEWVRWGITILLTGVAFMVGGPKTLPFQLRAGTVCIMLMSLWGVLYADSVQYAFLRSCAFCAMLWWAALAVPRLIDNGYILLEDIYRFYLLYIVLVMVLLLVYGGLPFPYLLSSERYGCGWKLVATGVANACLLALPFLVSAWKNSTSRLTTNFWLILLFFCFSCLLASKGRGSIGTAILISPLLLKIMGIRFNFLFLIITSILGIILIFLLPDGFFSTTLRLDSKDLTSYRVEMFELLWEEGCASHPLFGAGTGMDRIFLGNYITSTGRNELYTNPHNQFISVFFNWGWIGVIIFYSWILYVWKCGYKLCYECWDKKDKLPMIFVCWTVALSIESLNAGGLDTAGNGTTYLFWIFCGLVILMANNQSIISKPEESEAN